MESRDYEIIIVGAGPAGLSTGLHLAQVAPELAQRTLVLERARHPRPKLCAGGVLPGAEVCLRGLGLDLQEVPSTPVTEVHFRFRRRFAVVKRDPVCFRVVRREQFDAWLADAARERGLALQEETRVRQVVPADGWVIVKTGRGDIRGRVVVGADGAGSVVRRAVARDEQLHQVARLLEVRIPADNGARAEGQALFDFSCMIDGVQGYVWDFPQGDRPIRTWGIYDSRVYRRTPAGSLKPILQRAMAREGGALAEHELQGHPLRWFRRRAAFSAPHILLVGDAAGTDPVVGEGISFALGYGQVAAAALRDAFAVGDFSFADYRRHVLRHRIGRYLSRRMVAARLLYGLGNRYLLNCIWPLVGWVANRLLIDWDWGQRD